MTTAPPVSTIYEVPYDAVIYWPPGVVGELAQFFYHCAPRPVEAIAIANALAFVSGVAGHAFTVSGEGLNLYFAIIAKNGVGKEAGNKGFTRMLNALDDPNASIVPTPNFERPMPEARLFVHVGKFSSGAGVYSHIATCASKSNVAVIGEIGKLIKRAAAGDPHSLSTVAALLEVFGKSGMHSTLSSIKFAKKEDNVNVSGSFALSFIGDTTPGDWWGAVASGGMDSDGFLARMVTVEHFGPRPRLNENHEDAVLPEQLLARLRKLVTAAVNSQSIRKRTKIEMDGHATTMFNAFNEHCDNQINANEHEGIRSVWNRAHMNAWKIAGDLAVAENPDEPAIDAEMADWAIKLVLRGIFGYIKRLDAGEIGNGDDALVRKLTAVIYDFLNKPLPMGYDIPSIMQRDGVVPRKYLQQRTSQVSPFNVHKNGATFALDATIKSMSDSGYLVEMDKAKAGEAYTYQGKCYRVVNLPICTTALA